MVEPFDLEIHAFAHPAVADGAIRSPSSFVIFPSSTVARTPQLAWEAKHKALLYSTFDMVAFFLSCSRRFCTTADVEDAPTPLTVPAHREANKLSNLSNRCQTAAKPLPRLRAACACGRQARAGGGRTRGPPRCRLSPRKCASGIEAHFRGDNVFRTGHKRARTPSARALALALCFAACPFVRAIRRASGRTFAGLTAPAALLQAPSACRHAGSWTR